MTDFLLFRKFYFFEKLYFVRINVSNFKLNLAKIYKICKSVLDKLFGMWYNCLVRCWKGIDDRCPTGNPYVLAGQ